MTPYLIDFAARILAFAVAVFIVAKLFPGVHIRGFGSAVGVSVVYGVFNFIAYHLFGIFSVPFGIVTLGIGFWIINTILLVLTDKVVDSFRLDGIFWAALASLGISFFNAMLSFMIPTHAPWFRF